MGRLQYYCACGATEEADDPDLVPEGWLVSHGKPSLGQYPACGIYCPGCVGEIKTSGIAITAPMDRRWGGKRP